MTRTVEYLLKCITDHFCPRKCYHTEQTDSKSFKIIKTSFYSIISEWIDQNEEHILFSEKKLRKASLNRRYFVTVQKRFIVHRDLSWTRMLIIFARYVQVIKTVNALGIDIEPYLFEMFDILRTCKVNIWILSKPMRWHTIMDYFLDKNWCQEVF
jgi:hypothetical protein